MILKAGSTNEIGLRRVEYINELGENVEPTDAIVSAVVKDSDDNIVTGENFPKSLIYIPGREAYIADLDSTLDLVAGEIYKVEFTATLASDAGSIGKFCQRVKAKGC